MAYQVLDLSAWQKVSDFYQVKDAGVWGVMVKATEGTSYLSPAFFETCQAARQAGIHTGAYHYLRASNPEEARQEADFFLSKASQMVLDMPLAVDIEAQEQGPIRNLAPIASAFCNRVQDAGYYAMIYSSLNWFLTKLSDPSLDVYDRWIAQIKAGITEVEYDKAYGMWQYSWTGNIPGIQGNVDLDWAYKDYPTIIRRAGLNHLPTEPSPEPEPDPEPEENEISVSELIKMGYDKISLK